MVTKYCEFSQEQMATAKKKMRSEIFLVLRLADPRTRNEYNENLNVEKTLTDVLHKVGGFNSLLNEPPEIVWILSLLERARTILQCEELSEDNFQESAFRKLILDAGSEVLKIKEV